MMVMTWQRRVRSAHGLLCVKIVSHKTQLRFERHPSVHTNCLGSVQNHSRAALLLQNLLLFCLVKSARPSTHESLSKLSCK